MLPSTSFGFGEIQAGCQLDKSETESVLYNGDHQLGGRDSLAVVGADAESEAHGGDSLSVAAQAANPTYDLCVAEDALRFLCAYGILYHHLHVGDNLPASLGVRPRILWELDQAFRPIALPGFAAMAGFVDRGRSPVALCISALQMVLLYFAMRDVLYPLAHELLLLCDAYVKPHPDGYPRESPGTLPAEFGMGDWLPRAHWVLWWFALLAVCKLLLALFLLLRLSPWQRAAAALILHFVSYGLTLPWPLSRGPPAGFPWDRGRSPTHLFNFNLIPGYLPFYFLGPLILPASFGFLSSPRMRTYDGGGGGGRWWRVVLVLFAGGGCVAAMYASQQDLSILSSHASMTQPYGYACQPIFAAEPMVCFPEVSWFSYRSVPGNFTMKFVYTIPAQKHKKEHPPVWSARAFGLDAAELLFSLTVTWMWAALMPFAPAWVGCLGRHSLGVYLLQPIFVDSVRRYLSHPAMKWAADNLSTLLMPGLVTFVVALIGYVLLAALSRVLTSAPGWLSRAYRRPMPTLLALILLVHMWQARKPTPVTTPSPPAARRAYSTPRLHITPQPGNQLLPPQPGRLSSSNLSTACKRAVHMRPVRDACSSWVVDHAERLIHKGCPTGQGAKAAVMRYCESSIL